MSFPRKSGRRSHWPLVILPLLLAPISCSDDTNPVVPAPCNQCSVYIPAALDNTLYAPDGDRSNGVGTEMFVGLSAVAPARVRRALVGFDVYGYVPAGATVDSVRLSLTAITGSLTPYRARLYRLVRDWGESASNATLQPDGAPAAPGDATWTNRFWPDSTWSSPGGDFVSVPSGSTDVAGAIVRYTFNTTPQMVTDVQAWLDDPSINFGWIITGNENAALSGSLKGFGTHQNPDPERRPSLEVFYRTPKNALVPTP